jgi:hypothetical protein
MSMTAARGALVSAAAVVALAADQGGFAVDAWRWGAVALFAAAGLLWLWAPIELTSRSAAMPALIAAFGLCSLLSALWSLDAHVSVLDAQRTLLYLAAACCFALAGPGLAAGVVGGTTIVAAWALAGRLIHGAHFDPYEGKLLIGPVGYANGLGGLVAIGAAVALALALRVHRAFALPLVVLVPALLLTNSRGAELALAAGCVVALAPRVAGLVVAIAAVGLTVISIVVPSGLGNRVAYWHTAHHMASVGGDGAGTFHLVYNRFPPAHDAHSLYLQALAELGVVGLALAVAIVAVPLVAGIRTAAAAGLTVYAIHAGVDWDWQLPVVTVAALALAASALQTKTANSSSGFLRKSGGTSSAAG